MVFGYDPIPTVIWNCSIIVGMGNKCHENEMEYTNPDLAMLLPSEEKSLVYVIGKPKVSFIRDIELWLLSFTKVSQHYVSSVECCRLNSTYFLRNTPDGSVHRYKWSALE